MDIVVISMLVLFTKKNLMIVKINVMISWMNPPTKAQLFLVLNNKILKLKVLLKKKTKKSKKLKKSWKKSKIFKMILKNYKMLKLIKYQSIKWKKNWKKMLKKKKNYFKKLLNMKKKLRVSLWKMFLKICKMKIRMMTPKLMISNLN